MDFGEYGAWTSYRAFGEENAGAAAAAAEAAGLGTFWLGGSPQLVQVRPLLEGSEKLTIATSVVNIWAYDPADLAREYTELEADFPGRVCVGIGVGHPEATSDYKRPLTALEGFLDGLDAAAETIPVERRIIAALGPKMLAMSARRSLGTIPYFSSVDHTRAARAAVGPDALVIPEVAYVLDEDVERARATERRRSGGHRPRPPRGGRRPRRPAGARRRGRPGRGVGVPRQSARLGAAPRSARPRPRGAGARRLAGAALLRGGSVEGPASQVALPLFLIT